MCIHSSFSRTNTQGASATISFEGNSITVYGATSYDHALFSVQLDGDDPMLLNGTAPVPRYQNMLVRNMIRPPCSLPDEIYERIVLCGRASEYLTCTGGRQCRYHGNVARSRQGCCIEVGNMEHVGELVWRGARRKVRVSFNCT